MTDLDTALIGALADGKRHSGAELAAALDCSRTAVWKHLNELRGLGLEIEARRGSGYRLERPLELLDAARIRVALADRTRSALGRFELHATIASTNARLAALASPDPGRLDVVLAEYQHSGRGRRGRHWWSPFGSGLCLSLGWCFDRAPASLPALSLAIGVGVCRTLATIAPDATGLKWPNDIVAGDGKLGGLLVDVQGEADGPLTTVIGLGLNLDVSSAVAERVTGAGGIAPVGLRSLTDAPVSRNDLAARLIDALYQDLTRFTASGFAGFAGEWRAFDRLAGRPVSVTSGRQTWTGIARGIDDEGALLVDCDGRSRKVVSGDVTLRPQPPG